MTDTKTEMIVFVVGAGLMTAGISPIPFGEALLAAGSGVASFAYGLVFLNWKKGSLAPLKATVPAEPSVQTAAPAPASARAPPSPTQPPAEQPRVEKRKLPSVTKPAITLPKFITAHKGPIALIVIGLPLTVVGLILAGITPSVALGYGIFIPGVLLFGVGGLILFLQLYRKPAGVRRFCMHCGFPMMTTDFECSRCHLQPPSGVDTKACPNCGAVNPALAKFCKDCGAGQPAS